MTQVKVEVMPHELFQLWQILVEAKGPDEVQAEEEV
jgi:hypothetical protein